MTTEEINKMTNEFFDGELEKGKETILFTHLSLDESAREYFKGMNSLKTEVQKTVEEFPEELESRILYSIGEQKNKIFNFSDNFPMLFSYALAVILLVSSIVFYSRSLDYRESLETKIEQVNKQEVLIELLMNSLPQAEVKATLDNQVVVKPNS